MSVTLEKPQILEDYLVMPDEEIHARIAAAHEELGKRVVILGHHYQRDDVIRHADLTGDSYQFSVMASQTEAEYIVFCGVHFMAESADILGVDFDHPDGGSDRRRYVLYRVAYRKDRRERLTYPRLPSRLTGPKACPAKKKYQ